MWWKEPGESCPTRSLWRLTVVDLGCVCACVCARGVTMKEHTWDSWVIQNHLQENSAFWCQRRKEMPFSPTQRPPSPLRGKTSLLLTLVSKNLKLWKPSQGPRIQTGNFLNQVKSQPHRTSVLWTDLNRQITEGFCVTVWDMNHSGGVLFFKAYLKQPPLNNPPHNPLSGSFVQGHEA